MAYALELKNITKRFPGVLALNNMSLAVLGGEVHAVCGENGAGKSTLMKVCTGVYRPDGGEIVLEGKQMHFKSPNQAYDSGIAIMYQETSLFAEMTVLENMFLGHEPVKKTGFVTVIDYAAERKQAAQIFSWLNSDIGLDEKIVDLGMAQKQMVEIAKALTFQAKVLILDEPTASLTQKEVDALFEIIGKLKAQGIAVVYISHRLEEIFKICDRVTVVRDGAYISTRVVADTDKDKLVADMVGRPMGNYYPKQEIELGDEILNLRNIRQYPVIQDVSLTVRKGEIVGLSGLAGAGRTELALAISGLSKPDGGSIELFGKVVKFPTPHKAMEAGIVYVSEDRGKFGLVLDLSVEDNVVLPQIKKLSKNGFIDRDKCTKMACDAIEQYGIKAPHPSFIVGNLSGGNQQKVAVAKATALSPKLLILDEPTRGVDVNAKAEIHAIISNLAKQGLSILMISSEMPELLGMCDRIYVMSHGSISGCFDRSEATQEKILKLALNM